MITISETFAGARDFPLSGRYFKLLSSSFPVDVKLSDGASPSQTADQVPAGFRSRGPFDRIRIVANGGGDTVKFIVSDDEAGIDAAIVTLGAPISILKPQTIITVADVALAAGVATQILPADSTRQQALITNLTGNASSIRVGDANVAGARGVQVAAGQTITLSGTQAIFGFSPTLESVGVTVVRD